MSARDVYPVQRQAMFDHFKNPPSDYRLAPFWIWNAMPDPAEIERRIREMSARGIGGFIVCPSSGPTEDSSSAWSRCVRLAKETAESLGMAAELDDPAACSIPEDEGPEQKRLSAKLASSAVHAADATRLAARLFTDMGWDLTPERMKSTVDLECMLGSNLLCPEAMYYTLAGVSGYDSPPPQSYQSTFWPHYDAFADYVARLSYALSQGKHRAQVALLLPGKTFADETSERASQMTRGVARECFALYCEWLLRLHIDYDLLPEDLLAEATVIDQSLLVGGERYELLVMPPLTAIGHRAAWKIRELLEDGGRVMGTMLLPIDDATGREHESVRRTFAELFEVNPLELRANLMDGIAPSEARLTIAESGALFLEAASPADLMGDLRAAISQAIKLDVSVRRESAECPDILACARKGEDFELFFLCNQAAEAREVQISIRCDRAPLTLDLETGRVSALANCTQQGSRTILMHRFEPYASLLIGFHNEPPLSVPAPVMEAGLEIPLSNTWEFEALDPNSLPMPEWESDPAGTDMHARFQADHIPPDLALLYEYNSEAGDDRKLPSVIVNGKEAGQAGRLEDPGFRTFSIAELAAAGDNVITLKGLPGVDAKDSIARARPRLTGSFALRPGTSTLIEPIQEMEGGSWTEQGYPFYSGTGAYRQSVEIPPFLGSERVILATQQPADMVEFVVNGAQAGARLWAPFQIDITPLVKPGLNTIELRVTNSIANSILGEARPAGLLTGASLMIY